MIPVRTLVRRVLVAIGVLVVVVLSTIGGLSVTRGTPVSRIVAVGDATGSPVVTDSSFNTLLRLYTGIHLDRGSEVAILLNGTGTYPHLWRDLTSAQRTITVQMYFSQPGAIADTMARILRSRAEAGVRVSLLLDAFGSQNLTRGWLDSLRASGVRVALLRPLKWYALDKLGSRSHVRVVVVDGRIGYTGGFGLADYWQGNGRHRDQWRETNVRFQGPEVSQLQATFAAAWAEATGELITGDLYFPPAAVAAAGTVTAGLLHTAPTMGSTPAERFLALTIVGARKTLYITNSYFVPDDDFQRLLEGAAMSGVDVRVLTADRQTDIKTTYFAGRARYERLLAAGVRIFEYNPSMVHAKTIVVDDYMSVIGSMNFDNRSLALNNEANLVTLDSGIGRRMTEVFNEDLGYATEITLNAFRRRPWTDRVLERVANAFSRVL